MTEHRRFPQDSIGAGPRPNPGEPQPIAERRPTLGISPDELDYPYLDELAPDPGPGDPGYKPGRDEL